MGIKTLLNIALVAFLLVVIGTPLVETFILGRDSLLLSSTIYNSFRAAKEASYTYQAMRDIDALVYEQAFRESFAATFGTSYNMYCTGTTTNTLLFKSYDDKFNDFTVEIDFSEPEQLTDLDEGDAFVTRVTVTVESKYKFRTKLMQFMNDIGADPFLLRAEREYTMKVTN